MANLSFYLCIFIFFASLLIPSIHHGRLRLLEKHAALFIFGDSLFDPGNNNYINTTTEFQANIWPYGETFFKYPTGRFSDGRLIPDFIAEYAKLPLISPYLLPGDPHFTDGANFASGGAGALIESHQGMVVDLETQLGYFKDVVKAWRKKVGDAEAKKMLSRAVFLISVGGNDYLSPSAESYSERKYVEMVIGNLTSVIKEIYEKGGRKFGFVGIVPLGCLPNMRALKPESNGECLGEATKLAEVHNRALSKVLPELASQLKGFKYSFYDLYTSLSERINNPSKYGFKDGKTACCGTGPYRGVYSCGGKRKVKEYEFCHNASEYLFFDSFHPSEKAYQQFAEQMWRGPPNVTGPYSLEALFDCSQE